MMPKIKYILEHPQPNPNPTQCFGVIVIIIPILIGVVFGICAWDSVGEEKKVAFIMALVAGVLLLMNGFTFIIDICYRR